VNWEVLFLLRREYSPLLRDPQNCLRNEEEEDLSSLFSTPEVFLEKRYSPTRGWNEGV